MIHFRSLCYIQALAQCSGITLSGEVEDPKVAAWLLDPSAKEKSLHHLVAEYTSDKTELLEGIDIHLFQKGLSYESSQAHATIPKRSMGSNKISPSFPLWY